MFRNILVAIDGSETARRALAEAADLAEALNARLTIIAVAPEVPGYAYRSEIDPTKLEREAEAETERLLREADDVAAARPAGDQAAQAWPRGRGDRQAGRGRRP